MKVFDRSLTTPVLFLVFNRPNTAKQVFEAIRRARPKQLFIAADGFRVGRNEEEECEKVRQIATDVDWNCEVKTLLRQKNLGCRLAVSSAIDWFFENISEGIILEDDCLPHPTFFRFCQELLEKYRDDQRIMAISGDNFQFGKLVAKYSYYFSRFNHCWGWASWRRAWRYYDRDMSSWPSVRDSRYLYDILFDKRACKYWTRMFEAAYSGKIDTWDYQWTFACWLQSGLTILPNVNLVSNIGFEKKGTHTKGKSMVANLESKGIVFPLSHMPYVFRNAIADEFEEKTLFSSASLCKKIINKIYILLNGS